MKNIKVNCGNLEISNNNNICLIAGPCQLETEQHALDIAGKIKEICDKFKMGFIYKTSFDKANRTSLTSKRGAGLEKSLPIFDKIKNELFELEHGCWILNKTGRSCGYHTTFKLDNVCLPDKIYNKFNQIPIYSPIIENIILLSLLL